MTETSPLGAVAIPPKGVGPEEEWEYRSMTGRVVPGVELRIAADTGEILPWDGESAGEIEVRGPWVTASYHRDPPPTGSTTGGSAPATPALSTTAAMCASPTG
jgi:fatty-acyl-CoA synthase